MKSDSHVCLLGGPPYRCLGCMAIARARGCADAMGLFFRSIIAVEQLGNNSPTSDDRRFDLLVDETCDLDLGVLMVGPFSLSRSLLF